MYYLISNSGVFSWWTIDFVGTKEDCLEEQRALMSEDTTNHRGPWGMPTYQIVDEDELKKYEIINPNH